MSSPANSTRPPEGRSSAQSRCSSVDLPTPEAPITTTLSPGFTVRFTPRSTRTTSGPIRYSFSRSWATRSGSLIAQHVHRVQPGRPPRRRQRHQEGDQERGADDKREVHPGELHGQVVDLVDVAGEADDLVGVLHPDEIGRAS